MMWADIAIVVIVAVSALVSVVRGFLREVLSLAAWVIALWVAFAFSDTASVWFAGAVPAPSMRALFAFLSLFVGSLLAVGVVNWVIGRLMEKTGLSGTDRLLGLVFGIARGLAVVAVLVLVAGLLHVTDAPWWQESMLLPPFETFARWVVGMMPADLAGHFRY